MMSPATILSEEGDHRPAQTDDISHLVSKASRGCDCSVVKYDTGLDMKGRTSSRRIASSKSSFGRGLPYWTTLGHVWLLCVPASPQNPQWYTPRARDAPLPRRYSERVLGTLRTEGRQEGTRFPGAGASVPGSDASALLIRYWPVLDLRISQRLSGRGASRMPLSVGRSRSNSALAASMNPTSLLAQSVSPLRRAASRSASKERLISEYVGCIRWGCEGLCDSAVLVCRSSLP
eukprot:scaffold1516_cov230-Pinguiococcus_pyrenoidosus.AAC.19